MSEPAWVTIAEQEIGVKRFPDGSSNPRIGEYNKYTNVHGYDDKVAWCSTFLNWVFKQVGCTGTDSALARSWLDWGVEIDKPLYGCVVILERENPDGWQGHVGLYIKKEGDIVYLLGGNQLDEVRIHTYPSSTVLGFRWPE